MSDKSSISVGHFAFSFFSSLIFSLLIAFISINKAKATMKNAIHALRNCPIANTVAQPSRAAATDVNTKSVGFLSTTNTLLKSGAFKSQAMIGIKTSSTSDLTTVANAPPMIIPTAISIILPFNANFLNSARTPFAFSTTIVFSTCIKKSVAILLYYPYLVPSLFLLFLVSFF